jgi:hypothetical protein
VQFCLPLCWQACRRWRFTQLKQQVLQSTWRLASRCILAIAIVAVTFGTVGAGANRAGGTIVTPIMIAAGGDMKSGVAIKKGSANATGKQKSVSAAGNMSIVVIITTATIVITITIIGTIVINKKSPVSNNRAFFVLAEGLQT